MEKCAQNLESCIPLFPIVTFSAKAEKLKNLKNCILKNPDHRKSFWNRMWVQFVSICTIWVHYLFLSPLILFILGQQFKVYFMLWMTGSKKCSSTLSNSHVCFGLMRHLQRASRTEIHIARAMLQHRTNKTSLAVNFRTVLLKKKSMFPKKRNQKDVFDVMFF